MIYLPGTILFLTALDYKCEEDPEKELLLNKNPWLNLEEALYLCRFQLSCLNCYRTKLEKNKEKLEDKVLHTDELNIELYLESLNENLEKYNKSKVMLSARLLELEDIMLEPVYTTFRQNNNIRCSRDSLRENKAFLSKLKQYNVQKTLTLFLGFFYDQTKTDPAICKTEIMKDFLFKNALIKEWPRYFSFNHEEDTMDITDKGIFFEITKKIHSARDIMLDKKRQSILEECTKVMKDCSMKQKEKQNNLFDIGEHRFINFGEHLIDMNATFSHNELLCEYYLQMKKMLKSIFLTSLVAQTETFVLRESNLVLKLDSAAKALMSVSGAVPVVGRIISAAGITLSIAKESEIKKKLSKMADLAANYENLHEEISRLMTVARRKTVMGCSNKYNHFDNGFTKKLKKVINQKALTEPESFALHDTHIIQACLLFLIEKKKILLVKYPKVKVNKLYRLINF